MSTTSLNCGLFLTCSKVTRVSQFLSMIWDRQDSSQFSGKPLEKLEHWMCGPTLPIQGKKLGSKVFPVDHMAGVRVMWEDVLNFSTGFTLSQSTGASQLVSEFLTKEIYVLLPNQCSLLVLDVVLIFTAIITRFWKCAREKICFVFTHTTAISIVLYSSLLCWMLLFHITSAWRTS